MKQSLSRNLLLLIIPLLICSCISPLKQYYPDKFYHEDSIYENKQLRFLITYSSSWYLFTDPKELDKKTQSVYRSFHKSGMELLYAGATTDGLYGTRCIAGNFNIPIKAFAENIRKANSNSLENDQGLIEFYAGSIPAVKWIYDQSGFRFAEYFFKIDTYDIRISFWTKADLFQNYIDIFELIMSTLTVTGPSL